MAVGRMYNYEDEATCDKHVGIFLKAIDTVAQIPGEGFAAIKVSTSSSASLTIGTGFACSGCTLIMSCMATHTIAHRAAAVVA